MQGKEGKGDRRILRETWRRDGVASGSSDAWKMHLEVVKKSVGRRKRLPHKDGSPSTARWDRRFRLSIRQSARFFHSFLSPFLLLAIPFLAPAETIDRIAVSVGSRVITSSDIDREIRVVALLAGTPVDLSAAARRAAAGRMVEQRLIRRELEVSRYPVPSASEVEPDFDKLKHEHFPTDAAWRSALAGNGISEQEVKDEMLWVRTLDFFTDSRFRSGVQVSDEEARDYFEKTVKPAAEVAHPGRPASFEDYRDQIEETLAGQRVDREVDKWLAEARARTQIVYHDEAFQ